MGGWVGLRAGGHCAQARYGAVRGAMSLLGPVMWGWLAVDLAMKAVGTDYARIIRAVFLLAQVSAQSPGSSLVWPSDHKSQPSRL